MHISSGQLLPAASISINQSIQTRTKQLETQVPGRGSVTGHWDWCRHLFPVIRVSNVISQLLIDAKAPTFGTKLTHKLNFRWLPIGVKAVDSFMFHYFRNVCCGIGEQPHITDWYSPFNHPPPPAPHPCNHVSSYIIAFQLLTGVWPLPPNMPNLIHVFPKRQRDALFWLKDENKNEACINMLCHAKAIKRHCAFLLIQPGKVSCYF